jgi:hypothetical protein
MQESIPSRHPAASRATWAVALWLIVLQLTPALLRPSEFVQDDSYFYLQIADNIVAGHGSTFHGITPTNGYHPLWMAGVVAADFLAAGDRDLTLRLVVAIQALLALATAAMFQRLARHMGLRYWLAGLAVILCYLLGTGLYGSEAHLNAMLLVVSLLGIWDALGTRRSSSWFRCGVVLGLAILARLDNIFIAAALGAAAVLYGGWQDAALVARRALSIAFGVILIVAPYLVANYLEFGHLMPISGAIKSTFPAFRFDAGRLGTMGALTLPFGVLALVIGFWLDRSRERRVLWLGLGGGVVAHAVYVAGFTDHYTFWAWYYVAGVLAASLCVAWVPGWLAERLPSGRLASLIDPLALVLTILLLMAGCIRAWLKAYSPPAIGPYVVDIRINEYRWPEEFAAWLGTHLPAGTRVFVRDWPGAIAWRSGLSLLPMDGLVNDFRYNDELLALGTMRYLCAHRIRYFFGLLDEVGEDGELPVIAPLYRRSASPLVLRPENIVVRVRDVVTRPAEALPYALWRLDCEAQRAAPIR